MSIGADGKPQDDHAAWLPGDSWTLGGPGRGGGHVLSEVHGHAPDTVFAVYPLFRIFSYAFPLYRYHCRHYQHRWNEGKNITSARSGLTLVDAYVLAEGERGAEAISGMRRPRVAAHHGHRDAVSSTDEPQGTILRSIGFTGPAVRAPAAAIAA